MSAALAVAFTVSLSASAAVIDPQLDSLAHWDASGRMQIDVHFDCSMAPPLESLTMAGLAVGSSVRSGSLCIVEGWTQPTALTRISAVNGVTRISAPSYVPMPKPHSLQPAVRAVSRASVQRQSATVAIDANGISIMRADQFIAQTSVQGAGVTVGVQSVGVTSLSTIQARGELPAAISVLYPAGNSTPITGDEGTALLQEIHAVAPAAKLIFCGPGTFVDFTNCMTQLINAGATVLVDDIGIPGDDLLTQDNAQSSAITQILSMHPAVLMFSSAGNNNGSYWEGDYTPVSAASTGLPALSCPSGAGIPDAYVATFDGTGSETLNVLDDTTFPLLLDWADPPGQLTSQFDVFWFAAGSTTPLGCLSTTAATTHQVVQTLDLAQGSYTVVVASPTAASAGLFLKLWAGGDAITTLSVATSGSLVSPPAMVPAVLSIGAVNGMDGIGNTIETFSSNGPVKLSFPAPTSLLQPALVAPDGIPVDATGTFFAPYLFPDGNFYGTSASVANAGAVAALLRSAFPTLSVADVTNALERGAAPLGTPIPNGVFGYGRVDAIGALTALPAPMIAALTDQTSTGSASSAAQTFTVTGTGSLHFSVTSSNTTLVPSTLVSAGQAGVTLSAGCGSTTLTCTVALTPVLGQAGTATVKISVVDGANRSAQTQLTLTASSPAASSATTTTAAASTGHSGGGALQVWALLGLAGLVYWAQLRSRT